MINEQSKCPFTGAGTPPKEFVTPSLKSLPNSFHDRPLEAILLRALEGDTPNESEIVRLFAARGDDFVAVCTAADMLRRN